MKNKDEGAESRRPEAKRTEDVEKEKSRSSARIFSALRSMIGLDFVSFRGKSVLITGGSRGLGLILARKLADEGAKVAILARDEAELARAKDDIRRRGADVLTIRADVREPAEVKAAVKRAAEEHGPIEVLINNAGIITVGPMEEMTREDFADAMRTHFHGPLEATLAVLPEMRKARSGRIVNISSIGGEIAPPHMLPYVASKFALTGLSQGLRAELMKDGIIVTTVCPGLLRTGSAYNVTFKGRNRAEADWFFLADSLPPLAMSADRAARIILRNVRLGRGTVTLTIAAKIAAKVQGAIPSLFADSMGLVNRLMPSPGGIGTRGAKGKDSLTRLTSSSLTILTQRAARQNNELPPEKERTGTAQQGKQGSSEKSEQGKPSEKERPEQGRAGSEKSEHGRSESKKGESGKQESGKSESGKRESGKSDSGKSRG
ncbi:MAG: SDR family NAD(P)-dependent oxidoreductase [Polyangiaceae bacterium]